MTLVFSSCSSDNEGGGAGAGRIAPAVTVSPQVASAGAAAPAGTVVSAPSADELTLRISENSTGYSAEWNPLSTYVPTEPLLTGTYSVEAFHGVEREEGFDKPYFYGCAECVLGDGEEAKPVIDVRLANTMFTVEYSGNVSAAFRSCAVMLHCFGGTYIRYPVGESRQAFLRPGNTTVAMEVTTKDGKNCSFDVASVTTAAGKWYTVRVNVDASGAAPVVTVSIDGSTSGDVKISLTQDFINAPVPQPVPTGFVSSVPVAITEGNKPDAPLYVTTPMSGLSKLVMTTVAPQLIARGWPAEIDLLGDKDFAAMTALGLKITYGEGAVKVDFTDVIANLRDTDGIPDRFAIRAGGVLGKVSEPLVLEVQLKNIGLTVTGIENPVVGVDEGSLVVECTDGDPSANLSLQRLDGTSWVDMAITAVTPVEDTPGSYRVSFKVPPGTAPLRIRLLYCATVRSELSIERVSPRFNIEVDAFALKAVVRIIADDPALVPTITELATVYANGAPLMQIARDIEKGEITVSGLKESAAYDFTASVMDTPRSGDFCPAVNVVTESAAALPNGNFEEISFKNTEYKNMPSGGLYSQTIVEIFNLQNYTSYSFTAPQRWANVNAKTFCTKASHINTWYVIPSARTVASEEAYAETSYAIRLDNVAWDVTGSDIPPYLQSGPPYVRYSKNIPPIKYRAAGKTFLGSYSFNPSTLEETYNEGMAFSSRPSSLNGFYRFMPCVPSPDESGVAIVEVLDNEGNTIASGKTPLGPNAGYTAFRVPLTYAVFGKKAAKIKVMLSASAAVGDIAYETSNIVTVDDPVSATSRGSSLWVDELTLSY